MQMEEIYPALHDDYELAEMDQARGMRKLRAILNSSPSIAKIGVKRGAAYVYHPDYASEVETIGLIEDEVILLHLRNKGKLDNYVPYEKLVVTQPDDPIGFTEDDISIALNNLVREGILWTSKKETKLTEAFWTRSGSSNRISTSFTHSAATGWLMDDLVKELERLFDVLTKKTEKKTAFLPNSSIPIPERPSRSTAIEAAVAFATLELSKIN